MAPTSKHIFRCGSCRMLRSTLEVRINERTERTLDEGERGEALQTLRRENNAVVLDVLADHVQLRGARLLDIGSAHGWFLAAASAAGARAEGVEPDRAMAEVATARGAQIRIGYFPEVLDDGASYDVLTFNDVLEHLPDISSALDDCRRTLSTEGLLAVNIPNSGGLAYRLARMLAALGIRDSFDRLWQVGLPSPHLWYFDEANLTALARKHGLDLVTSTRLKSVTRTGLWSRVHFDRSVGPMSVVSFGMLWLLAPIFNARRASDIMLLVFRRAGDAPLR